MHVAEQPREIDECIAETKKRPMELLADVGALSSRFVAVHATHLLAHEAKLLGGASGFACICRRRRRTSETASPISARFAQRACDSARGSTAT